jgi:hypothetical protein
MKRKIYNLATVFSVVLLAATVWWWTHSRSHMDQVTIQRDGGSTLRLTGSSGKVMLTRAANPRSEARPAGQLHWSSVPYSTSAGSPTLAWTSFSFTSQPVDGKGLESTLILPVWLLTLVFAVFPLLWVAAKFKKKPKKA